MDWWRRLWPKSAPWAVIWFPTAFPCGSSLYTLSTDCVLSLAASAPSRVIHLCFFPIHFKKLNCGWLFPKRSKAIINDHKLNLHSRFLLHCSQSNDGSRTHFYQLSKWSWDSPPWSDTVLIRTYLFWLRVAVALPFFHFHSVYYTQK